MTVAAIELVTDLNDEGCGCDTTRTYADFARSMRKHHPEEWRSTSKRLPVAEGWYQDTKHAIGGNPKAIPNPDAVPLKRQRQLSSRERTEHRRQQARWRRFGEPLIQAESEHISLSQAALLATVRDGWIRCSRLTPMERRMRRIRPTSSTWIGSRSACLDALPNEP